MSKTSNQSLCSLLIHMLIYSETLLAPRFNRQA